MHSMNNTKVINTQQARIINRYRNTKEKLRKTEGRLLLNKCADSTNRRKHLNISALKFNGNKTRTKTCNQQLTISSYHHFIIKF